MELLYRTFLFSVQFITYVDSGFCYTKMIDSLCYPDTTYFLADTGRLCCKHYDAMGYTESNNPAYDYNLKTNHQSTSCSSCNNYIESESVVCYNRARHNACWNVQQERKPSPKACCENNPDGGYARNLTLFINPEGYVAHYTCTSCYRLHSTSYQVWTEWSPYSACSTSCGYGVQKRHRSCRLPPQIGICEGGDSDVASCFIKPCENTSSTQTRFESRWSEWTISTFCNVTCGTGVRIRQRHCIRLPYGSTCHGKSIDHHPCQAKSCTSSKRKIGVTILIVVGAAAVATIFIIIFVCIHWKCKEKSKRLSKLFNNKRSQSMQVVFMVSGDETRDKDQGIDNLALQYPDDDEVTYVNTMEIN